MFQHQVAITPERERQRLAYTPRQLGVHTIAFLARWAALLSLKVHAVVQEQEGYMLLTMKTRIGPHLYRMQVWAEGRTCWATWAALPRLR